MVRCDVDPVDWGGIAGGRSDVTTVGEGDLVMRCEPTPLPTAGEKIRSSSSLGSKAGCFLLDRDALAMG